MQHEKMRRYFLVPNMLDTKIWRRSSLVAASLLTAAGSGPMQQESPLPVERPIGDDKTVAGESVGTIYEQSNYYVVKLKHEVLPHEGPPLEPPTTPTPEPTPKRTATPTPVPKRIATPQPVVKTAVPEPEPRASVSYTMWDDLAYCETTGDWSANTGNGYYGGLQFDIETWYSVGGVGNPAHASREEQIYRGQILHQQRGFQPWPG